jgi:hypothetical protein
MDLRHSSLKSSSESTEGAGSRLVPEPAADECCGTAGGVGAAADGLDECGWGSCRWRWCLAGIEIPNGTTGYERALHGLVAARTAAPARARIDRFFIAVVVVAIRPKDQLCEGPMCVAELNEGITKSESQ